MTINLGEAFKELFSVENRHKSLVVIFSIAGLMALANTAELGWVKNLMLVLASLANVSYGLEAVRRMHSDGDAFQLPEASALITKLPLGLAFGLANFPHLIAFALLCALGGAFWPGALGGIVLWLVVCYFFAWMLAYDALVINFTRRQLLGDALNLKKAFGLINRARGAYLQAALLPFLYTFLIYLGLAYLDGHGHGVGRFLGQVVSQVGILWNLLALQQFLRGLQPAPTETQEPGFSPT